MNVDNIYTSYDLLSNSLYSNYCANCLQPSFDLAPLSSSCRGGIWGFESLNCLSKGTGGCYLEHIILSLGFSEKMAKDHRLSMAICGLYLSQSFI